MAEEGGGYDAMPHSYWLGAAEKRFVRLHVRAPNGEWQAVYLPIRLSRVRQGVVGALPTVPPQWLVKVMEEAAAAPAAAPAAAAAPVAAPVAAPAAAPAAAPVWG